MTPKDEDNLYNLCKIFVYISKYPKNCYEEMNNYIIESAMFNLGSCESSVDFLITSYDK